jgi:hypothetical protein
MKKFYLNKKFAKDTINILVKEKLKEKNSSQGLLFFINISYAYIIS